MARVLVVLNDEAHSVGAMAGWLGEMGCAVDERRPYRDEGIPTIRIYHGLIVLGGSMAALDDSTSPWLPIVRDRIREAAELGVPTLGIGLGHQLAAVALGGRVTRSPYGSQLGLLDVGWGCEVLLDPLFDRVAGEGRAMHWNADVVTALPDDSVVLAQTPNGEVQAARMAATVWGVQFHPEANADTMAPWMGSGDSLPEEAGVDGAALIAEVGAAWEELVDAWQPLTWAFARMVRGRAGARGELWE